MPRTSFTLIRSCLLAALIALLIGLTPRAFAIGCDVTQLIDAMNSASSGANIDLASGCTYTLTSGYGVTGVTGLPDIGIKLTINGNGATIKRGTADGTPDFRLFYVTSLGNLNLNNLSLLNGSSPYGGGAVVNAGWLTVSDVTLSGNFGVDSGGALYNSSGMLTVLNSTFFGNAASAYGGGIYSVGGSVWISDSTLNNNSAHYGGGVFDDGGTITISNSTLVGNTVTQYGGGIGSFVGSTVMVGSSIIAGNTGLSPDISATIISLGYNVIGSTSGTTITGTTTGNLTDAVASPLNLGALAYNGGATQTMALGAGSVAIRAGNCSSLSGVAPASSDQRGYPTKTFCDAGAYESQNLIQNADFGTGINHWGTFDAITYQITGGVFQFYRNSGGASAVVLQGTGDVLPSGAPLTVSLDLGNSSSVRKRAVVLLHESDFTDLQVCSFWIPPHTALRTYQIRTHTTKAWTNASLSVYASPADGLGYILLDNVDYEYHPELDVHETLCIDPGAPSPGAGEDSANLITNGGFSSGLTPWGTFGHITSQIAGGVFKFYKTAGTPSGVVLQNTGVPVAGGVPLEARFQLGNTTDTRKRVTILLQAADFSDLQVCTFWLAPNTPLQHYVMRTYSTQAWGGATVSVYPSTVAASGWTLLDNVSLVKRPTLSVSGTECYEPGSGVAGTVQPLAEVAPSGAITVPPVTAPQIPEVGNPPPGEAPQHPSPTDTGGLDAPPPGN